MRRWISLTAFAALACPGTSIAQTVEKELVMTISDAAIDRGIVSEIVWDGAALIVQSAVAEPDGQLSPRYYAVAGPGLELRRLASVPASAQKYWDMKASRVSPTGLGRISSRNDAKMPMYGVGSLESGCSTRRISAARTSATRSCSEN